MPDPQYPFLTDLDGQQHKREHNRLVRFLATRLRDEMGFRVKPAEIQLLGADERLSLRARGQLWDVVFIDEHGTAWAIELKRITGPTGRELPDL